MTPPEWRHVSDSMFDELRSHGVACPREREYVRKTAAAFPVLAGVATLEGPHNISITIDMSDKKRLEGDLRQAQKMEASVPWRRA